MKIEAVIFDMDGLMLDTEPIYRAAWQQTSRECGFELTDEMYVDLVGKRQLDAEEILQEKFGPNFPIDEFRIACRERETILFTKGPIVKKCGLDELLAVLDSRRIPKAVATSTNRRRAQALLETAGLLHRFEVLATGDDVANGKPEPDIFILAARRLGVANATCLVLEDAEAGVVAADRAGMIVYVVPDIVRPSATVQRLASGVFDSLGAVAHHLENNNILQPS